RALPSLAPVTARADLAIGAAGGATWERLCLAVPSLVVTLAANQEPSARALATDGYVHWIGCAPDVSVAMYRDAIVAACERPLQAPPPLVDGLGAPRVAEKLMPSPASRLRLRPAVAQDAEIFFDWRNESVARRMSFTGDPVDWERHRLWFARKLADESCILRVVEIHQLPLGHYRLDWVGGEATLSYLVDPVARGRGLGSWLVSRAMADAAGRHASVRAEVKAGNGPSLHVFRRLRFSETAADGKTIFRWQP
ncbi:MAG TPA: bifunctional UDP-2,4-diacetamido-2,4,6-trideoxy-beta-L-altropyranose hydrolase/GNAT family N-acetyltransferase, partial [Chloroflexota bacterium]|nr:bifunctional UDP-2,4-diacetamido-2,4,6-trideoxy-beta-L-altropyranose hydrolase/GNAT family N-acetyltransferase [Chloroflexota bacterium]